MLTTVSFLIILCSGVSEAAVPPSAGSTVGDRMESLFRSIQKPSTDPKIIEATFAKAELLKKEAPHDERATYFWTAVAGTYAQSQRNFGSLKLVKRVETELIGLVQKDPCKFNGGVAAALSSVYDRAPRIISVGSNAKAVKYDKISKQCQQSTRQTPKRRL